MPRNVTRGHPLIDPIAVWDASQPAQPVPVLEAEPAELVPAQLPEALPQPVLFQARPAVHEMGAAAQAACSNGHPLFHGARFCPECGVPAGVQAAPEPQAWTCPQSHQNAATVKFCPEDGSPAPWMTPPVVGAGVAVEMAAQVKPEELLSPAERAERERKHAEAVRLGSQLPEPAYERPQGQTETIHMLEDGLTFAGVVWMRGQEITLVVGSERWEQAQVWWKMPEFEQVERYGHVKFRTGPWPGRRYEDAAGQFEALGSLDGKGRLQGPGVELLTQASQRERQRAGGVPAPVWR